MLDIYPAMWYNCIGGVLLHTNKRRVKDIKEDLNFEEQTKLVAFLIGRHLPTFIGTDMYEDMYQVGCMGLWYAYKNFDETLGFKFSTYASKCILGYIKRYLKTEIPYQNSKAYLYIMEDDELKEDGYLDSLADPDAEFADDIAADTSYQYYMDIIRSIKATDLERKVYEDYLTQICIGNAMSMDKFSKRHGIHRSRAQQIINRMHKRAVFYINRAKSENEPYEIPDGKVSVRIK